jgi:hypothetical protein
MKKFQITITLPQLRMLERALNILTRVGIGQFDVVGETIELEFEKKLPEECNTYWKLRDYWFDPMKNSLLGFGIGASYGIGSPEVSDRIKIAYDVQESLQQIIAKLDAHNEMSVWHNGDILHLGSEPRIVINEIEIEETPDKTIVTEYDNLKAHSGNEHTKE